MAEAPPVKEGPKPLSVYEPSNFMARDRLFWLNSTSYLAIGACIDMANATQLAIFRKRLEMSRMKRLEEAYQRRHQPYVKPKQEKFNGSEYQAAGQ